MKILQRNPITLTDARHLEGLRIYADALRQLRAPLLDAFDIYKSNVYYGVIEESEQQHEEILAWYRDLCDLKESAIATPPHGVQKYLKGGADA